MPEPEAVSDLSERAMMAEAEASAEMAMEGEAVDVEELTEYERLKLEYVEACIAVFDGEHSEGDAFNAEKALDEYVYRLRRERDEAQSRYENEEADLMEIQAERNALRQQLDKAHSASVHNAKAAGQWQEEALALRQQVEALEAREKRLWYVLEGFPASTMKPDHIRDWLEMRDAEMAALRRALTEQEVDDAGYDRTT